MPIVVTVGMVKMIEERDRKLAERGIFTVEQEIAGEDVEIRGFTNLDILISKKLKREIKNYWRRSTRAGSIRLRKLRSTNMMNLTMSLKKKKKLKDKSLQNI